MHSHMPQIHRFCVCVYIYIYIYVGTCFEAQTQYVKGYRPSEHNTTNL